MAGTALIFRLDRVTTPTGPMRVLTDEEGRIRSIDWDDHQPRMEALLRRHYGMGYRIVEANAPAAAAHALEAYFDGDLAAIDALPVATNGTEFQRLCWAALRAIPAGAPASYAALAARIGRPNAVRAVGHANGANPISIVVPCHRLIGSDAALTGYGGGIARKRWLLDHERAHAGADVRELAL